MLQSKKRKKTPAPNGFTKATFSDKKTKLANWLSHKTNGYSPLQKKIGLFAFCLLVGGAGLSTVFLFKNLNVPDFITQEKINSVPILQRSTAIPVIVSEADFIHIENAKKILDSLKNHDSLKFYKIMKEQPLVLKNIALLESIYHSQKK